MAELRARLSQNVDGEFFVDHTCIDCDTCRQLAPAVYSRSDEIEQSYVSSQPQSDEETTRALMALVACPTSSIGTVHRLNAREAARRFPELVADNIYYCGFTSAASFGASSYLVRQPDSNFLVDSPRAAAPLVRRLREMGGVRRLLLTHRDDVADHKRLRGFFNCERVLHEHDVSPGTRDVEVKLTIREPAPLGDGVVAIPVPGHTRGSVAYLYLNKYLFTGDHLWWSPKVGALHASYGVCWYNWRDQIRSMERLLDFRFEWVLPGHGQRYHASARVMKRELEQLIARMRKAAA
jgi:glyoxylase-like metal-dependent hydrolase (beta-lactamase superfamily II)/ferredoxin